jgi:enoyl-CoA hydratase/carnithine racemase
MEIVLAGGMVSADEALQMGIVNRLVPPEDLDSVTMALAEEIATKSPYVTKVAKRAVRGALDLPFSEGVLMERAEFVALFDTEDKEIGVRAFLERSDPDWVGR